MPGHQTSPPSAAFSTGACVRYGLLGLPLAFVALPLYVILPNHYAREYGVPLATLGTLLLLARLLDALTDPLLGRFGDRLFAHSPQRLLAWAGGAAVMLALGFAALFYPAVTTRPGLLIWAALALAVTYAAYSFLTISHQSWGARHGGSEAERSRLVGWREACGLAGVLLASVLPLSAGTATTITIFSIALSGGFAAWCMSAVPPGASNLPNGSKTAQTRPNELLQPLKHAAFQRLLVVFLLNGIASAVPATLLLFYVQDRLQAAPALQPAFLGSYFLCAALAIPLWLQVVKRWGLARTWAASMLLAIAVFLGAWPLGAGDEMAFLAICALSGVALGADLALPSAMLAGVVQSKASADTGAYFGWWAFATKLNLALAAGLALPLLSLWGYQPDSRETQALAALSMAYCLLPCALKASAAACLYFFIIRKPESLYDRSLPP